MLNWVMDRIERREQEIIETLAGPGSGDRLVDHIEAGRLLSTLSELGQLSDELKELSNTTE